MSKPIPDELYRDHEAGMSLRGLAEKYGIHRNIVTRAIRDRASNHAPRSSQTPGGKYQEIIDEVDRGLKSGNVSPMARPALLAQKRAALDKLTQLGNTRDGRDKITTLAELVRMDAALDKMAADQDERQQLDTAYAARFGDDERELLARLAQRNKNSGPKPVFVDDEDLPAE